MSNIYLVDLENVSYKGLLNAKKLNKKDEIIIFYSKNVSIDCNGVKKALKNCKAKVTFKEVYICGKNSLDFQLVAHLGTLINKAKDNIFYIVSKDKDYCSVILFFKDIFDTYLIPKILVNNDELKKYKNNNSLSKKTNKKKKNTKQNFKKVLIKDAHLKQILLISEKKNIKKDNILRIINNSKDLCNYHNSLFNEFGKKGRDFYEITKEFFKKFKNADKEELLYQDNEVTKKFNNMCTNSNLNFEIIIHIVKISKSNKEYYLKLSKFYGQKGKNFHKYTKNIFHKIKKEIN